ncbi:5-formyltetrahydrofolate cyclo-ligase [Candidatus Electronema sp. JM]|uniref:5-formyltetrahydrofolate cyclo-ligase n=1 Tax=Candidatus Electronema sp. JM TaxID=3401571 RepID=UPI003AA94599
MNDTGTCTLRRAMLAAREQIAPASRAEKSRRIYSLLLAQPEVTAAAHVFVYVHFRSEVETLPLLEHFLAAGKTVSVPLTLRKEKRLLAVRITEPDSQLAPGCFGILEPTAAQAEQAAVNPAEIDLAVVPGSVFDRLGGRLGYGGGYYDRFLNQDAPQALRAALAYELQLADHAVPLEAHDQLMDILVTEEQCYDCRRNRDAQDSNIQG